MVPKGWKVTPLGELLQEHDLRVGEMPGIPNLSLTKKEGLVPSKDRFARVLHNKNVSRYRLARRDDFVVDPMLLWDGALARLTRFDFGFVSPDYRVFAPAGGVDLAFLEFLLRGSHVRTAFQNSARGTNVRRNRISRDDFLNVQTPLPPLAEQRRIAEILTSVDESIRATEALIRQMKRVKQGLLAWLLKRGIGHSRFRKTEMGRIPAEWRISPLVELLSEPIRNGYSPISPESPTGKWVLSLGAVTSEGFNASAIKPAPLGDPRVERCRLKSGDFLVSRSNTKDRVGFSALFRGEIEDCAYPDLLMRFRVDETLLHPPYLEYFLRSPRALGFLQKRAAGTSDTMVKITKSALEELPVMIPPIPEQEQLVSYLNGAAEATKHSILEFDRLQTLKRGLLSDLLSGRVRVKVPRA